MFLSTMYIIINVLHNTSTTVSMGWCENKISHSSVLIAVYCSQDNI